MRQKQANKPQPFDANDPQSKRALDMIALNQAGVISPSRASAYVQGQVIAPMHDYQLKWVLEPSPKLVLIGLTSRTSELIHQGLIKHILGLKPDTLVSYGIVERIAYAAKRLPKGIDDALFSYALETYLAVEAWQCADVKASRKDRGRWRAKHGLPSISDLSARQWENLVRMMRYALELDIQI